MINKRIALTAILFTITLLLALTCLFPILSIEVQDYNFKFGGYDCLGTIDVGEDESAKAVLPFINGARFIAIVSLIGTVISLLMCFYHYNYDNARIAVLVVVCIALLTSLAYLILGAVLLGQVSTYMTSSNTLSYLPFVLICVLAICYFFCSTTKSKY